MVALGGEVRVDGGTGRGSEGKMVALGGEVRVVG